MIVSANRTIKYYSTTYGRYNADRKFSLKMLEVLMPYLISLWHYFFKLIV